MKAGDTFKVHLGANEVAEATLVEIDGDQAILEIPATRIVMGIQSTLGDLAPDPNAKERMILGPQEQEEETDPVRRELLEAGIELDEDPDFVEGRSDGEASLKELIPDDTDV